MTKAKRKRHGAFLCAVLAVLAAAVLRLIGFQVEDPLDWTCAFARSVIYIVLFAAWAISVRGRIIQPQTRRCLTARSKSGKAVCKSPWIKGRRFNTTAPQSVEKVQWTFSTDCIMPRFLPASQSKKLPLRGATACCRRLFAGIRFNTRGLAPPPTPPCETERFFSKQKFFDEIKGQRFNTAAPFLRASDPSEPARPDSFSTVPLTGADAAPAVFS